MMSKHTTANSRLRLGAILAAAIAGLSASGAHAANWTNFTPGAYNWATGTNWSINPNYPGDGVTTDNQANFIRTTAIGGGITVDIPTLPGTVTGWINTLGNNVGDSLTYNVNGVMNVNATTTSFTSGSVTGNNANGRITVNVNTGASLNITGNISTNTGGNSGTTINVAQGSTLTLGTVTNGLGTWNINGDYSNTAYTMSNNDGFSFNINATAGNVNLGNFTLNRSTGTQNAGGPGRAAITNNNGLSNLAGLHIRGGTVTINNLFMGFTGSNSSSILELAGGTVTVNGVFLVGGGGNNRAHVVGQYGGIMNVMDVNGIQLGNNGSPGTYVVRGGVLNTPRVLLGGNGGVFLTGETGTAYIGSGGIVSTNGGNQIGLGWAGSTATIGGTGGTLGASADWSTSFPVNLYDPNGTTYIKTADANNNPFNITMSGALVNGSLVYGGGFTKLGTGTLTLSAATGGSYSGPTIISAGKLLVASPVGTATGTGTVTIQSGAAYGGVGNDSTVGAVTIEGGATLTPGVPGVLNNIGIMNLNSLTLASGAIINLDFKDLPASNDSINIMSGSSLSLGGSVLVNIFKTGTTDNFNVAGTYEIFNNINPNNVNWTLAGDVVTNLIWNNTASGLTHTFTVVPSDNDPTLRDIVLTIGGPNSILANAWTGAAGTDWGTLGNWSLSVPNAAGAVAAFPAEATQFTVNLNGTRTVGSFSVDSGANPGYTFNGGQLVLNNNGTSASIAVAGGANTINSAIELTDNTTISSLVASNTLTLNGAISSAANRDISITGPGWVILAAANQYGATTIAPESNVQLGNGSTGTGSFGTGAVTNNGRITLNYGASATVPNAISGAGTLTNAGTGTVTLTGANTYTGRTVVNVGSTLVVDYATGSLAAGTTVFAPGTITFRGGAAGGTQAFTTALNLQGGTLNVVGGTGGTMAVTFNGGTLGENGRVNVDGSTGVASLALGNIGFNSTAGTFVLTVGGAVGGSLTLSTGTIASNAVINVNSGGTATLTAATTTFASGSTINVGGGANRAHLIATAAVIGSGTNFSIASNGVATMGNTTFNGPLSTVNVNGGTLGVGNMSLVVRTEINLGGGASTFDTAGFVRSANLGVININGTGTIVTTATSATPVSIIGGWATLNGSDFASANAGLIVPSSSVNNTWNGDNVSVTASTLVPAASTANSLRFKTPGALTVTLAGANTITSGAILNSEAVGANTSTITGGTIQAAAGTPIVVNQRNTAGDLIINSAIGNNGSTSTFIKVGPGVLVLGGPFGAGGVTTVVEGTLKLGNSNVYVPSAPNGGWSVSNFSQGIDMNGFNAAPVSVAGNGTITNTSATTTSVLSTGTVASTFAGVITGPVSLVKTGSAQLTLRGLNTLTGDVVVESGNLLLDNNGGENQNILPQTANVILRGGDFRTNSQADAVTGQVVTSTLVDARHSIVTQETRASGNRMFIGLGTITRTPGATLNIDPQTGNNLGVFTLNPAGSILGGWVTMFNNSWANVGFATSAETGAQTAINTNVTYNGSTLPTAPLIGAGIHTDMTASTTAAGPDNTLETIRFNNATASTLDLVGGLNTVTSGGILVTGGLGNNAGLITGGSLTSGNGTDLIIHQYNTSTAGSFTIASSIVNPTGGTIGLTKTGGGNVTLTGDLAYTGPTIINAGRVTFGGGKAHSLGDLQGHGIGSIGVAAGTSLTSGTLNVNNWQVDGTHTLRASSGVSKANSITVGGTTNAWTGKIDLTNNTVVLASADAAAQTALNTQLNNQLLSGRAGGTWTGNGITSSTVAAMQNSSIALVDASDIGLTTFAGQALNANSTVLTIARNGDATLDGQVNAFDLNILAANWQTTGKIWSSGDFTFDGSVDAFDLNVLAANWQFGTGGSFEAALASFPIFGGTAAAVPEPASLAVLALGGAALLGRRRRKA